VVLLLVIPGSQILVYPILWILMPSENTVTAEAWLTPVRA
jgi:phage shock protein PspC (stress-responsive transcriptional regulator)